jgi:hypothetical protein
MRIFSVTPPGFKIFWNTIFPGLITPGYYLLAPLALNTQARLATSASLASCYTSHNVMPHIFTSRTQRKRI